MDAIELKAGQELDALIAEKVMGQCMHKKSWFKKYDKNPDIVVCNNCNEYQLKKLAGTLYIKNYSTSISDAFEVVEKLRDVKIKEDPSAEFTIWQYWEGGYVAGYSWHEMTYYETHADTAPLAICLAALKVMESQNDQ